MAKILADREIKKLCGTVILGGDDNAIHTHGIRLHLGNHVQFLSTGEEKELKPGYFLVIHLSETVLISSLEKIDFTKETVQKQYPKMLLMGLLTPTTTMMREGLSLLTTKVDAGFRGNLNWGIRNNSINKITLEYGEPIFKLTIFLLETEEELSEVLYGEKEIDHYQDTEGIRPSARRIPTSIPKSKIIASSYTNIPPTTILKEAGYPFNHIGTELVELGGKFDQVSKDVIFLKQEFQKQITELSSKIVDVRERLSEKIENVLKEASQLFDKRFGAVIGALIGAGSLMYTIISLLQSQNVGKIIIACVVGGFGVASLIITYFLTRRIKVTK
ncbi:hypothetical protein CEE36_04940 [candidate division TA06 bacterium B3_TA06]|uniref:dUTPase-like domain-containing protein n=1 Tax=candidate division TA06 bacterium B3_TA06 TaxID=2012487 RepID=A0A532V7Z9_UNCT6|nr:MAG: hypothetical protein CEE36_04940 [candidate division TA06 bacterium B3_TA06]